MHHVYRRVLLCLSLALVTCFISGCGGYAARRIAQAPNRYPSWLAPQARFLPAFEQIISSNLPSRYVDVGPPAARLRYRLVPAADYKLTLTSTNTSKGGRQHFDMRFKCDWWPGHTNEFTTSPRGTVVLLHGYGLGGYAMYPWALRLAEDGWRCVLVDLRGHGESTGERISFGIHESHDLSQLLDKLEADGELVPPVSVVGMSYGASLALRWKATDPRVGPTVAIAPYAVLSNAVVNICRNYMPHMPGWVPRTGMKHLPDLLKVDPGELDPLTVMEQHPVKGLVIGGLKDTVAPPGEVLELKNVLSPGSKLDMIWNAPHETVAYQFETLTPLVEDWIGAAPDE